MSDSNINAVISLTPFLDPQKDINIDEGKWVALNRQYTQRQLSYAIVELKCNGQLRTPAPLFQLQDALNDFQSLQELDASHIIPSTRFDTKYNVPLPNPLGILPVSAIGTTASDFFHYHLRSRVGDYHSNRGIAVRWERMTHGNSNFLSAIWSLKLKKLTRITLLGALRMRLVLVSQFRPASAKAIYTLYGGGDVLDFCGGWGDRLAAAAAAYPLVKSFTIVEPRPEAAPLYAQQLANYGVTMPLTVHSRCAEDVLPELDTHSFDIVFTSPPYFDCEHYGDVTTTPDTQSHRKFRHFEVWLHSFLFKVVGESIRLLRPNGVLVLNINDIMRRGTRHLLCTELLTYVQQQFNTTMNYLGVWGYPMSQRMGRNLQGHRQKIEKITRVEPVYVWRKK